MLIIQQISKCIIIGTIYKEMDNKIEKNVKLIYILVIFVIYSNNISIYLHLLFLQIDILLLIIAIIFN